MPLGAAAKQASMQLAACLLAAAKFGLWEVGGLDVMHQKGLHLGNQGSGNKQAAWKQRSPSDKQAAWKKG